MNETIEQLVQNALRKKLEDGSINKIIDDSIEKMTIKGIEEALIGWNDNCASKLITEKLKGFMNDVIEKYDFHKYLTKITDVLDRAFNSSILTQHRKLVSNLKIELEPSAETVKTSELFEKYQEFLERENLQSSDTSLFDFSEGAEYVEIEMRKDENSGEWLFKFNDELIENEKDYGNYTIRVSLGRDYNDDYIIRNVKEHSYREGASSLRFANSFTLYLLKLQQNYTKIIIDETEMSDSVSIERTY